MAPPLSGVKVLDLTQFMAGPYCTMLLADMGADVIKIEKPDGGDDTRRMGPPFLSGESAAFLGINRNKRSAVLNLKSEAGVDTFRRLVGREDLLEDARFATNADRMQNLTELTASLEETFARSSTACWLDLLEKASVPCGPIYDLSEVYTDPQVLAREMVVETTHPAAGPVRNIGIPVKLSESPGAVRSPVPTLGQHTDEVLAEYGFSDREIVRLKECGAVP